MTTQQKAAELAAKIENHLTSGGVVQVTTYGRSTLYNGPKFASMFRASGNSVEVRRGRSWDAIMVFYGSETQSGASIRFGRYN